MIPARRYVNRFLRNFHYSLERYEGTRHPLARRMWLLERYEVDLVLDVGANVGLFAAELRAHGYRGRIVSFEPLANAYERLARRARKDPDWQAVNVALGDEDERSVINVAGNSESSSLLTMLPRHVRAVPESAYVGTQECEVRKLDSIWERCAGDSRRALLKIDTQGFEGAVLEGAAGSLSHIVGIQLELSTVPLYESSPLFSELIDELSDLGYELHALEQGFTDPKTGRLYQIDGTFYRLDEGD